MSPIGLISGFGVRSNSLRLALGLAAAIIVSLASDPLFAAPLSARGAWIIDFDDTQCTALRKFGSPEDPVDFMIRPAFNGQSYELFVGRKGRGVEEARTRKGTVDLGQGEKASWFVSSRPSKTGLSVFRVRLADADVRASSAAKEIRMQVAGSDFHLATGDLNSVLKTLDSCVADLRDYWNDGIKSGSIATEVKGNIRSVFTHNDYPGESLQNSVEGSVQFTLLIDEQGAVVGCDPLMASGAPLLELMGCQVILARAKFAPALDKSGKPVRSTYVTPAVHWRIEE